MGQNLTGIDGVTQLGNTGRNGPSGIRYDRKGNFITVPRN